MTVLSASYTISPLPCDTDGIEEVNYMDWIGRVVYVKGANGKLYKGIIVDVVSEGYYIVRLRVAMRAAYQGVMVTMMKKVDRLLFFKEFYTKQGKEKYYD